MCATTLIIQEGLSVEDQPLAFQQVWGVPLWHGPSKQVWTCLGAGPGMSLYGERGTGVVSVRAKIGGGGGRMLVVVTWRPSMWIDRITDW